MKYFLLIVAVFALAFAAYLVLAMTPHQRARVSDALQKGEFQRAYDTFGDTADREVGPGADRAKELLDDSTALAKQRLQEGKERASELVKEKGEALGEELETQRRIAAEKAKEITEKTLKGAREKIKEGTDALVEDALNDLKDSANKKIDAIGD